jgi:hypothetical protein
MTVTAGFDVGGIEPKIRPVTLDRPAQEGLDPLVDLSAEPGETCDLLIPSMPIALTSSSTERVEMPWT